MKKTTVLLLAALALGACNSDTSGPDTSSFLLDDAASLAYTGAFAGDPGMSPLPGVQRLPDNLRLTEAQQAQIKALFDAFQAANQADIDALAAIMKQAHDAMQAGKPREEVKAILDQAAPIRERLIAAETKLRTDIMGVLTAEQKAWLEANRPQPCTAPALTEAQRNEISALIAAFQQANKTDLDAIKAALEQARAAQRSGASRDRIKAILDAVKPAMERVRAAEQALRTAIDAVLTAEQRNARCAPLAAPGPGGPQGPRGIPMGPGGR